MDDQNMTGNQWQLLSVNSEYRPIDV